MRAVVQRVAEAEVMVGDQMCGRIGRGLLVLAGLAEGDGRDQVRWMAGKIASLRVFPDEAGTPSRWNVAEAEGDVLAISQFTLVADCRKGRRPSFDRAMPSADAAPLFGHFVAELRAALPRVATGQFGADMQVRLVNDGPFTLVIDF